jgi:hypothetical protein
VCHQRTSVVPYEKPSCRVRNTSLALNPLLVNKFHYGLGNVTIPEFPLGAQYGGSGAHAAVFKHQRGDWQAATRVRDKLISLRRAINNGWYDDEKQGAINLFLGHYQPCLGQSELWNLDSDHYLHSGALPDALSGDFCRIKKRPCLKCTSARVINARLYLDSIGVCVESVCL